MNVNGLNLYNIAVVEHVVSMLELIASSFMC